MEELEVQLQSTQADLKSAHKRIDQLHGALKDHEEFSGDEDLHSSQGNSLDNLSSTGSSYSLDDGASLDFTDESDEEENVGVYRSSARGLDKRRGRDASPVVDYKARKVSKEVLKEEEEEDEFAASRRARQKRLQQLEEEEKAAEASRKARQERMKHLEETEDKEKEEENLFGAGRRGRQDRVKDLADEDDTSRKTRQRRSEERDKDRSTATRKSSVTKKAYEDDDDDDDDDLEEFLLKQRERMRKLADDVEEEEEEKPKSSTFPSRRKQADDSPVTNGKTNGVHSSRNKSDSREVSEEPPHGAGGQRKDSVDEGETYVTSRQRRKRQRRRTIEQLTSPEHQAAKANGVDL